MIKLNNQLFYEYNPLNEYNYYLPSHLIAQRPMDQRDQARLLIISREGDWIRHSRVFNLLQWLNSGDLLVVNNTQVVPARLWARKPSGGQVEILLLNPTNPVYYKYGGQVHNVLLRSHRPLIEGQDLILDGSPALILRILRKKSKKGNWLLWFPENALSLAYKQGQIPLPPYIKRPFGPTLEDLERYQTVYASRVGAIAAPTAGLHFTNKMLMTLQSQGINIAQLTLHIGYGTFVTPSVNDFFVGRLHAEWVDVPEETSEAIIRTKQRGGKIIAVGTTTLRALEWQVKEKGVSSPRRGWCDLFITPGFQFQVVDSLFTNFHLPYSTLLMLVSALVGKERLFTIYAEAIRKRYRFYSFGDAMLIL